MKDTSEGVLRREVIEKAVERATTAIAQGGIVIVIDAESRENGGHFVCAAETITPDLIQFMTREGAGLLCMPILPDLARAKGFEGMVQHNTTPMGTPYAVPVDHASCRTGISPEERHRTVQAILDPSSKPHDFVAPGHLFLLFGREGGVLRRAGRTEAAIDLASLAGLRPSGVLCEICSRDGTGMANRDELDRVSQEFDLPIVSIQDIIRYRRLREKLVRRIKEADTELPTRFGPARILAYDVEHEDQNPIVLVLGDPLAVDAPLVRMHSSCFTGDLLDSLRCDCGDQLHLALDAMGGEGAGVLVYLPQEGRGIGLIGKLRAYRLQDGGMDTVEANEALGFPADMRDYMVGLQILADLGLSRVRLLTNNPKKVDAFVYSGVGIEVVEQVPVVAPTNPHNARYLATKRDRMGHEIP